MLMAMPTMRAYNLNGLVEVRVDGPERYLRYFDNEYQRIGLPGDAEGAPVVTLFICDELPKLPVETIRFKKLFTFRYCTWVLDTEAPRIYFERHWLDRFYLTPLGAFIQCQLLEPLIYWKLLERGVLFMHAAGVAKDGKAHVFPAHGGTGKTTRAISLLQQGYELLGDDLLMIDAETGTVYPYARPLHLFAYNLRSLEVPLSVRLAIRAKDALRFVLGAITRQRFLISTRVHIDELMPVKFGEPAALSSLTFLTRGEGRDLTLDASGIEEATTAIIESADLNDSLREYFGPAIDDLERSVVAKALALLPAMRFENPRAYVAPTASI